MWVMHINDFGDIIVKRIGTMNNTYNTLTMSLPSHKLKHCLGLISITINNMISP